MVAEARTWAPTDLGDSMSDAINDPREAIFTVNRPWGNFQQLVSNQQVTVKIDLHGTPARTHTA